MPPKRQRLIMPAPELGVQAREAGYHLRLPLAVLWRYPGYLLGRENRDHYYHDSNQPIGPEGEAKGNGYTTLKLARMTPQTLAL